MSLGLSALPKLFDTTSTPGQAAAVSSAAPRSARFALAASTIRIWHVGQIALTISTSRDSSTAQLLDAVGSGLVCPLSFTCSKVQPWLDVETVPVGHAGRSKLLRYWARSLARFGSP